MKARPETTRLAIEALERSRRQIGADKFKSKKGYSAYLLRAQNRRIAKHLESMQN